MSDSEVEIASFEYEEDEDDYGHGDQYYPWDRRERFYSTLDDTMLNEDGTPRETTQETRTGPTDETKDSETPKNPQAEQTLPLKEALPPQPPLQNQQGANAFGQPPATPAGRGRGMDQGSERGRGTDPSRPIKVKVVVMPAT